MKDYPKCAKCGFDHGKAEIPPRHFKCINCGYCMSELYIKNNTWEKQENNRMGYDDFEGLKE